jgi:hypothetical protein
MGPPGELFNVCRTLGSQVCQTTKPVFLGRVRAMASPAQRRLAKTHKPGKPNQRVPSLLLNIPIPEGTSSSISSFGPRHNDAGAPPTDRECSQTLVRAHQPSKRLTAHRWGRPLTGDQY